MPAQIGESEALQERLRCGEVETAQKVRTGVEFLHTA